jgi:8-oxo-dGTP pyrophosphatase MutT (NUDIX family)
MAQPVLVPETLPYYDDYPLHSQDCRQVVTIVKRPRAPVPAEYLAVGDQKAYERLRVRLLVFAVVQGRLCFATVVQRNTGNWSLPGGSCSCNKEQPKVLLNPIVTACKEAYEELNLLISPEYLKTCPVVDYAKKEKEDLPRGRLYVVPMRKSIDLSPNNSPSEISEAGWYRLNAVHLGLVNRPLFTEPMIRAWVAIAQFMTTSDLMKRYLAENGIGSSHPDFEMLRNIVAGEELMIQRSSLMKRLNWAFGDIKLQLNWPQEKCFNEKDILEITTDAVDFRLRELPFDATSHKEWIHQRLQRFISEFYPIYQGFWRGRKKRQLELRMRLEGPPAILSH